jgi:spore coat polysaccharide biosynthesis protein SpsF (cytidylyltransferase family)
VSAPLCVIQARHHSQRFPGKMLAKLGNETLIARGHRMACEVFGEANVVVAIPADDAAGPLGDELRKIGATVFPWSGDEADVLSRFWACAHTYRWHRDAVIVRWTPDDPFKDPQKVRAVVEGVRHPAELGAEAFTLAMLDEAHERIQRPDTAAGTAREHITHALFPTLPPPAPAGVWTIDTAADLETARKQAKSAKSTR